MAISLMNKVNLLAPENELDNVLKVVQELQQIQIINLNEIKEWQSVNKETKELIEDYDQTDAKPLTDNELLQELTKRRQRIERAIFQIEEYVSQPSFFEKLKQVKPSVSFDEVEQSGATFDEYHIVDRVNHLTETYNDLADKIESTKEQLEDLRKWKPLTVTPNELNKFQYVRALVGTVPSTNEDQFIKYVRENVDLEHETVFIDEHDYGVIIFLKDFESKEIIQDLKDYQFTSFEYTSNKLPADKIIEMEATIKQYSQERADILNELKNSHSLLAELKLQYEYVANLSLREQAKLHIARTQHLISIQGWIEVDNTQAFLALVKKNFEESVIVKVSEVSEQDLDQVPTKLKNNGIVEPFEMLTTMYGLPNYREIDPTPLVMPFFFVFFGMMIADLGYGLLLMLLSAIPLKLLKLDKSKKNTVKLVHILSWSIIGWGLVYGSFFGFTLPFQLIDINNDITVVMIISIGIGLVHLLIAFGLNVYLKAKDKKYALAYTEGLAWMLIILGLLMLVIGMFFPAFSVLSTVGGWVAALSLIGIFVGNVIEAGSISGLGGGLLGLINGVSYFGDVISYSRLMALGLSGVSIAAAFNMIVAYLPPVGRFTIGILIFVALHFFNLFLSMLTAAVHSLRLIFVEFFGKFYTGNGQPFKPLKTEEKYINLSENNGTEE